MAVAEVKTLALLPHILTHILIRVCYCCAPSAIGCPADIATLPFLYWAFNWNSWLRVRTLSLITVTLITHNRRPCSSCPVLIAAISLARTESHLMSPHTSRHTLEPIRIVVSSTALGHHHLHMFIFTSQHLVYEAPSSSVLRTGLQLPRIISTNSTVTS